MFNIDIKFNLFDDGFWERFWEKYRENFRNSLVMTSRFEYKVPDIRIKVPSLKLQVPDVKIANFETNLFSEKLLDEIKIIGNLDFDIVDKSFKMLRYEYVKSFLYRTEPKVIIKWNPVISDPINNVKHVTNVEHEDVVSNSNAENEIHKATPQLISFILGEISANASEVLNPIVKFLSSELLPFIPEELRPMCFWIIVFLVVFRKDTTKG